jgi:HlyD family secretion protein
MCSRRAGTASLVALVAASLVYLGCRGRSTGQAAFDTVRVTRGDIEHRVIATGRIEPFSKIEIRSKADGIVKTITVDEGDLVQKGQTLIELDRDILASRVKEARAAVEKLRARFRQAQIEAEAFAIEVNSAQKRFERAHMLFVEGLTAQQQIEDIESALAVAKQQCEARQAAVSIARADLSATEAALERSEDELAYATIASPVDGIVLHRDVDVGSAVASVASTLGTLLMTLGDTREMHMVGDVDESDIGLVREGMPARIIVESYPGREFDGRVTRISPLGIEKDKIMNFEVEMSIAGADVPLRTNMTADAEIIVEERTAVLLVPQNAIRYARKQSFVEMPAPKEESGKRRVDVTLGVGGPNSSEVISGLAEGDEVIVSGT